MLPRTSPLPSRGDTKPSDRDVDADEKPASDTSPLSFYAESRSTEKLRRKSRAAGGARWATSTFTDRWKARTQRKKVVLTITDVTATSLPCFRIDGVQLPLQLLRFLCAVPYLPIPPRTRQPKRHFSPVRHPSSLERQCTQRGVSLVARYPSSLVFFDC